LAEKKGCLRFFAEKSGKIFKQFWIYSIFFDDEKGEKRYGGIT
jgi:hypothetical protein